MQLENEGLNEPEKMLLYWHHVGDKIISKGLVAYILTLGIRCVFNKCSDMYFER